jgi:hypothetical protein
LVNPNVVGIMRKSFYILIGYYEEIKDRIKENEGVLEKKSPFWQSPESLDLGLQRTGFILFP